MDSTTQAESTDSPFWLTEDLITDVLRKAEGDPGIKIIRIDTKCSLEKGENYASVVHNLSLTYCNGEGQELQKSLISKSMPESPLLQRFASEANFFDKELYAYSKLIPAMASLTKTPLVSAKLYPTEREDVVILEDMSSRGFRMADRKKRLDLHHSFLALKALAKFHGLSLAVVQKEPAIVDHFPESMYSSRFKEMNSQYIPTMYNSLANVIETWPGYERFAEKIRSRIEGIVDNMKEMVSPKKGAFNVLNHGDFWVNNMLFRYKDGTQTPEEVCLIDLQIIRYGSPALDLQYFLATSLAEGIREEYEDLLLEAYHTALTETLNSVALQPSTYTLEDLKQDFQEKNEFGFNMGCFVTGAVVADSSEAFEFDTMTEESLKDGSVNPMEKAFHGKRFKDALQKLLLYYEDKGVV